uniref:Uncharacterized protein n=1 Tax=Ditylenchus dipsaci TaxID=166011 RepID=A0A915DZL0_9BILA
KDELKQYFYNKFKRQRAKWSAYSSRSGLCNAANNRAAVEREREEDAWRKRFVKHFCDG